MSTRRLSPNPEMDGNGIVAFGAQISRLAAVARITSHESAVMVRSDLINVVIQV
jgi:hypothetical protein